MQNRYQQLLDDCPDYQAYSDAEDEETRQVQLIGEYDPEIEEAVTRLEGIWQSVAERGVQQEEYVTSFDTEAA